MSTGTGDIQVRGTCMGRIRLNRASGCWVDLFDGPDFRGNSCRLHGPADFVGLRVREKNWGEHVDSLAVGPTAYVECFRSGDFDDTVLWFLPGQTLANVSDLECSPGIDTFRVSDRPPFAYERGYAAYMLWAASHLARLKE